MASESEPVCSEPAAASATTLLTCGWGLIAAYLLFDALLIRHIWLPVMTAVVPLIVAWATLERKRWGRLALLGLSVTVLASVTAFLALGALLFARQRADLLSLQSWLEAALQPYGGSTLAVMTLLLAVVSSIWLRRPAVAAEFEQGKRATLAMPQRIIAAFLVGCWAAVIVWSFLAIDGRSILTALSKPAPNVMLGQGRLSSQSHSVTKRASRSEAELSNL